MIDFLQFGEHFLNSLLSIGAFLLDTPFSLPTDINHFFLNIFDKLGLDGMSALAQWNQIALDLSFPSGSLALWLFGIGLCSILAFRLMKFFFDIFL